LNWSVEKRYNALLQLTLYNHPNLNATVDEELKNRLKTCSSIFLDKLLIDSYNDLCNKDRKDIFSEYIPDYVRIIWIVFGKFNVFKCFA
jgi:hypothetical protein